MRRGAPRRTLVAAALRDEPQPQRGPARGEPRTLRRTRDGASEQHTRAAARARERQLRVVRRRAPLARSLPPAPPRRSAAARSPRRSRQPARRAVHVHGGEQPPRELAARATVRPQRLRGALPRAGAPQPQRAQAAAQQHTHAHADGGGGEGSSGAVSARVAQLVLDRTVAWQPIVVAAQRRAAPLAGVAAPLAAARSSSLPVRHGSAHKTPHSGVPKRTCANCIAPRGSPKDPGCGDPHMTHFTRGSPDDPKSVGIPEGPSGIPRRPITAFLWNAVEIFASRA